MKRFTFNWGWGITFVYTTFALATLGFVAFAMTQSVDLVRDDYYQASLDHDKTMAARKAARALGTEVSIEYGTNVLHIHIPPDQAASASGTVYLYHSALPDNDRKHELKVDASGTMVIPTSDLPLGVWRVTLAWEVGGERYESIAAFTVR